MRGVDLVLSKEHAASLSTVAVALALSTPVCCLFLPSVQYIPVYWASVHMCASIYTTGTLDLQRREMEQQLQINKIIQINK